jgi:hypothetical protein
MKGVPAVNVLERCERVGGWVLSVPGPEVSTSGPPLVSHRLMAEDWIREHLRTSAGRQVAAPFIRGYLGTQPRETSLFGVLFDLRPIGSALARAGPFHPCEGVDELARRLAGRVRNRTPPCVPRPGHCSRRRRRRVGHLSVAQSRLALRLRPPLASRIAYTPRRGR